MMCFQLSVKLKNFLGLPGMDLAIVKLDGPLKNLAPGHLQPEVLSEKKIQIACKYFDKRLFHTEVMLAGMGRRTSIPKDGQQGGSSGPGKQVIVHVQTDIRAHS